MRLLLFLLLASGAAAQPAVVSGVVRDSTGAPLPGANVYLSGTQRGDATDARGAFEIPGVPPGAYRLVASMVGYAPEAEALTLDAGDTVRVAFVLRDAPVLGPAAEVEGERDRTWEKRLRWFSRELIGESALADSTRILNPEVLDFRVSWGELTATARAPLVIENLGLGYRLRYDLAHFAASPTRVSYDGDERFEPLAPEDSAEAARWATARETAYRGSLQHILRSLLAGRAEDEGFTLMLVYEADRTMRGSGATFRTSSRHVMRVDSTGWGTLRVPGRLEVAYTEREDPAYPRSAWFREPRQRPASVQRSALHVGGRARIDPQGTPEDPFAVSTSGYLAFERLADRVPEDYVPPAPEASGGE